MLVPDLKEYLALAASNDVVPVYRELLADMETPVSMLARFADSENVFLLESMEGGETWGRYSFLGIDPEPFLRSDHSVPGAKGLEPLREVYCGLRVAELPGLPRFFGGCVGFIGYEAAGDFERLPPPRPGASEPRSAFVSADKLIVFDNVRHALKIVVCTRPRGKDSPAEAYAKAATDIERIERVVRAGAPAEQNERHPPVLFRPNMEPAAYMAMVEKAKQYIFAGDIIQAVLSQRFDAETDVRPIQVYRALRLINPSPYTFFLKVGGTTLIGSSPEVMVRLTGRRVELRPIAGTRPRGATEPEDRRLADELLADEKEKAEHVMLVDLGRNDLGRIAETASVQVTDYMVVERYSHVMHLVSHVEAQLRADRDALDVIASVFPAGTLSGAPKIRAMEIINELEPECRGAYGGAVGYISYTGNMDLAITIRTLVAENGRMSVQAGAGVVFDSVPERELEETRHKARAVQRAVELAANGLEIAG
ncbi:MAG: anthranilate synthase component I [Lentisphaerae bacterium]|nr:anthranilate synthase component I [Lentisphaerota bacterium]